MNFLLNTVAMSLTAISIFSAPLSQAETVESLSFSTPLTKANEVSKKQCYQSASRSKSPTQYKLDKCPNSIY